MTTAKRNVFLLYVSTDYVFDGKQPPFSEQSAPNPLNEYGRLKRAGEQAVLEANPSALSVIDLTAIHNFIGLFEMDYLNQDRRWGCFSRAADNRQKVSPGSLFERKIKNRKGPFYGFSSRKSRGGGGQLLPRPALTPLKAYFILIENAIKGSFNNRIFRKEHQCF